jgi:hypothetical protein
MEPTKKSPPQSPFIKSSRVELLTSLIKWVVEFPKEGFTHFGKKSTDYSKKIIVFCE